MTTGNGHTTSGYVRSVPAVSQWALIRLVRHDADEISEGAKDMTWIEDWAGSAACRDVGPDVLFVRGAEQNRAKRMCSSCIVRTECLAEALDNRIEWGVWGGMTERERRALLRRRPNVTSWRSILEVAAAEPAAEHSVAS